MHTVHAGYSIVAQIKKDYIPQARLLLEELNENSGGNSKIPFDESPSTHFVTGTILPEQFYNGEILPATLILATSFSGPTKEHLDELLSIGSVGLCEIFVNCTDFPQAAISSRKVLKKYLKKHRHWDTFYTSLQYSTKSEVLLEQDLKNYIEDYMDSTKGLKLLKPVDIRKKIQNHVKQNPDFKWAWAPSKRTLSDFIITKGAIIIWTLLLLFLITAPIGWSIWGNDFFILGTGLLISIVVFILIILFSLRSYEKKEGIEEVSTRQPDEKVKAILREQSNHVMNTMTVSGGLKKGAFRTLFFGIALRGVVVLRSFLSIPTVYSARWMSIDKGRRLVFLSNFTNTSESYVRDFIDNKSSAKKINLLFGQGAGYPITNWIMGKGALDDPNAFLYEVMTNHHSTPLWYCPYKHLSLENIKTNRQIHEGLFSRFSWRKQYTDWLNLF